MKTYETCENLKMVYDVASVKADLSLKMDLLGFDREGTLMLVLWHPLQFVGQICYSGLKEKKIM